MPEVAGNAAVLIDPSSITELHNAITAVLFDNKIRLELESNAYIRSKEYSWSLTSQKTLAVYNMIYSK
uniref:CAZy families GT4 protein n=1 Tax=uncultured Desulfurivibrio sp. TaxID=926053 RepID=A0A060BX94_9BACT|nr:CAZy families GT4 protein [uncultured Desulfurivibrio sp.]